MSTCFFEGGAAIGDGIWTLEEFLNPTSQRILVIGPNLHHLAQNERIYWPKVSTWLADDRQRSLDLIINQELKHDRWPQMHKYLQKSKQVFGAWLERARDQDPPFNLRVHTLRAIIRTGMTIVNPESHDAVAIVVPLITQPIPGDKFYIVIQRVQHPTVFNSVWQQVTDLCGGARPLRARTS